MNERGATNLRIAGGRAAKREWLGDFAAKGRITPEGWEVEARIPWSVLRLPGKGPHDLRFNVGRDFRRYRRQYTWAQTSNGLVQNYGRWKAVELPAAASPTLQLLPYVYGGADDRKGVVANSGVDLRYALSPELDLVGTINPDLRNVERGVLDLDFSYFERLANETRPFFLEGRDYFGSYDAGGLFASQRIGNFDAGLKSFGKLDAKTNLGILLTEDFGHQDAVVARVERQVDPRTSWRGQYVGGGQEGRRNDGVAASYDRNLGDWSYDASLSGVRDDVAGAGYRGGFGGQYSHDRTYANLRYSEVTKEYRPRLGFSPQTDNRGFSSYAEQNWAPQKGRFLEYGVGGYGAYKRSYDLSRPFQEEASVFPHVTFRDGLDVGLNLGWSRFFGGTNDQTYGFSIRRPVGDPYRNVGLSYEAGTRSGRYYRNASLGAAYRPLPTFQLNANLQTTTYLGTQQEQTILSANYDLDLYHSVGGRVVNGPGVSNFYVSFRQSGNRGTEYFLILGDPNAPHFRTSLILKAVFPVSARL